MSEQRECGNTECTQSSCENCSSKCSSSPKSFLEELNSQSVINRKIIGVVSGKGGVGKSFVTSALASALAKKGYKVGILDADITGPSIPKMFNLKGKAFGTNDGIVPMRSAGGIEIMSLNLLLDNEDDPVIWRGPVIAGVVKQFWTDVVWGELDYLLIDMPPGTGDVPLTVFQSIPVDGIVMVTSPQDLVSLIVKKACNMANAMNIPIYGMIENYSYLECPDCGKKISVFGESSIDKVAAESGLKVLGRIPIMPEMPSIIDEGRFEEVEHDYIYGAVSEIE